MPLFVKILLFYLPLVLFTLILEIFYKKIKWYFWFIAIFAGMIAIIPSALIQFFVPYPFFVFTPLQDGVFSIFLTCFLLNGLIEEASKAVCSMIVLPKKHDFTPFLLLSVEVALSFSTFENIVYIISGMKTPELRMISASVVHIICSFLSGIFIWNSFQKKVAIRPMLSAIFVHTLYNFFVSLPGNIKFVAIAPVAFGIFQSILFYQIYRASGTRIRDPKSPRLVR